MEYYLINAIILLSVINMYLYSLPCYNIYAIPTKGSTPPTTSFFILPKRKDDVCNHHLFLTKGKINYVELGIIILVVSYITQYITQYITYFNNSLIPLIVNS